MFYSGNDYVKHLVLSQDSRLKVKSPRFAKKREYNGTNIRRLMLAGGGWKKLVPPAVANVIEQVNGIERMSVLAGSDTIPQRW
jgi:nicotinamide-nucleotide adenylyltransferase